MGRFMKKGEAERRKRVSESVAVRHEQNRKKKSQETGEYVSVGRRIFDLALLAQSMWCEPCDIALSFRYLEEERQQGLACIYKIRCYKCHELYNVASSTTTPDNSGCGRSLPAVNLKLALGCIDSGIAHDQLNKLLSAVNLPTINRKTIKLAEDRVGPAVVDTAKESCKEAIALEKRLSQQAGSVCDEQVDSPSTPRSSRSRRSSSDQTPKRRRTTTSLSPSSPYVDIIVKYDFGWDKRGNGFVHNSHSGRGSMVGSHSNQILGFVVKSTYCAPCARGVPRKDHVCVKNHKGSAKSMEPVAAVELCVKNPDLNEAGVRVTGLVGDKDSSTIAALRRESPHPVQKFLDRNHNLKSVNNPLWILKKTTHRWLTRDVIEYIKRCVTYAITQNLGNAEGIKKAVENVAPHIYGDHEACSEVWCLAKNNPSYGYKHLPEKKALSDPVFRQKLEAILAEQGNQADQLAHGGTTQQNESFNHMCNVRAPKSRHYSGTSALERHVAAAVCHKILGAEHLERTFKKVALSPSVTSFRKSLVKRHEYMEAYQRKPEKKKRRLFLKLKDSWKDASAEAAEGLTYVSGMGNSMERAADASRVSSWLPEDVTLRDGCRPVIVDIETTGRKHTDDVVQIAAKCGNKEFNVFMVPKAKFHPDASRVTGMHVEEGSLFRNDELLITTPTQEAVQQFVDFLKESGEQVLLVGHNFIRFDGPRIMKLLAQCGLAKDLCSMTFGLTDTLPLISQGDMKKQDLLADTYLTGSQWSHLTAHDALSDCLILDGLLRHFQVDDADLVDNVLPIREFMERCAMNGRKHSNRPQLAPLKDFGVSDSMIGKMAGEGVTVAELVSEYRNHGRKGLDVCLGVQLRGGKPRVTKCKRVLDQVENFVKSRQSV